MRIELELRGLSDDAVETRRAAAGMEVMPGGVVGLQHGLTANLGQRLGSRWQVPQGLLERGRRSCCLAGSKALLAADDLVCHEAVLHQIQRQVGQDLNPAGIHSRPIPLPDRRWRIELLPSPLPALVQLFASHQLGNEIGRVSVVVGSQPPAWVGQAPSAARRRYRINLPSVFSSASTSSTGRKRVVAPLAVETLQNSQR